MLIQELRETMHNQVYKFQGAYFKSSQIHQLTIMYHFDDTNHDIILNLFVSKFLRALNLHQ